MPNRCAYVKRLQKLVARLDKHQFVSVYVGELALVLSQLEKVRVILDAHKAHHVKFHRGCNIEGPLKLPQHRHRWIALHGGMRQMCSICKAFR